MSSADEIASAMLRCIEHGTPEIAVPAVSGKLATLGYLFPSLMRALRPTLERRGARAKRKYLARKQGG